MEYNKIYNAESDSDALVTVEMNDSTCNGEVMGRWISLNLMEEDWNQISAFFNPEQARYLADLLMEAARTIEHDENTDLLNNKK